MRRASMLACAAALLLVAPAGFAATVTLQQMRADQKIADIHSLGVIVLAGQSVAVQENGITAFENSLRTIAAPDWRLDPVLAADIVKALPPRFNAVVIPLPADMDKSQPHDFFSSSFGDIADAANALPGVPAVDAYLIVLGGECETGNNQHPNTGFILMRGSVFGTKSPYSECIGLSAGIIDAKSGSLIYFGPWFGPPTALSGNYPWGNEISRPMSPDFAPPPEGTPFTSAQSAALRADFLSLAESGVIPSLKRIRLLPRDAGK